MKLIEGFANPQSTTPESRSSARVFASRRRPLYPGGPYVSPVGFGGYRTGLSLPHQRELTGETALSYALSKGLNLIDTSTDYASGRSEVLIGRILAELHASGKVPRESVVVVTKAGYVRGSTLELARSRELENDPFLWVSKFGESVWHCIHPRFLQDQIERSRARLGLKTIDVYLLHNPEYMLKGFELSGMPLSEARHLFYSRLKESFLALEEMVEKGWISAYGISSNNLGAPDEEYASINIKRVHECALSISSQSHFRIIQMPLNWLEPFPLFHIPTGLSESTLAYARRNGLGVLTNRPFNAMVENHLVRLTRPPRELQLQEKSPGAVADLEMQTKIENWSQLAADLERLARQEIGDVPGYEEAALSQIVLATLSSLPGVSSVLCGMRRKEYVQDAEEALALPFLPSAVTCLGRLYKNLEFTV